jgi:hypothetical protein
MNRKALNIIVTGAIIIAVALIAFFAIKGKTTGNVALDENVAKWIGEHSVVYVQAGCHACVAQEQLFGDSWKYINAVDCIASESEKQACVTEEIAATPTWIINGQKYVGVQTIDALKELTGYK